MNEGKKSFVYIGPNRPFELPIMRNAILAGAPEAVFPQLTPLLEEHKSFRKLFVPVSGLAQARASLNQPGSALAAFSAEIKKASDNFKAAKERK